MKSLAIIGDFEPKNHSHLATNDSIRQSCDANHLDISAEWVGTEEIMPGDVASRLASYRGFWIAPGSPYKNMDGVLAAIRLAREKKIPLLGTCGGFQHIVLEYARNVLGMADADHEETAPNASKLFISRLVCSLKGRTMEITLQPQSHLAQLYGRSVAHEGYYCNFGMNPEYIETVFSRDLRAVASDAEGVVRAVEIPGHPFFIGTLFLPQLNSTGPSPHPLISGFLKALA